MRSVSIIIPCFNGEAFVAHAIESALNQTYLHKEVIVVDDGSTDGSLSIIRGFGDQVRWITGPNRGGSSARNAGLELAAGEFVQFLDADDILHPEKLVRQLPLLQEGVDMVYSDWYQMPMRNPAQMYRCRVVPTSQDSVVISLDPQNIQTNAPLHTKSSLLKIGGFCPGLPCCQEREMLLRLARSGVRFNYLPEVLHTVRLHSNGVSGDEKRIGVWMKRVLLENFHDLEARGELNPLRRRAFGRLMMREARVQFRLGNPDLARECVKAAEQMDRRGAAAAYKLPGWMAFRALGPERAEALLFRWKRFVHWLRGEHGR